MSVALTAYRFLTTLLEPLAPLVLRARARRGKEDPARLGERLGRAGLPRPEGPLVWFNAVSVGESLSVLPLVARIRQAWPDLTLLVTSTTTTSASLLAQRLPEGVIHQYAPLDTPSACTRFFDHWKPDLLILIEGELWPNLTRLAASRGCKLALVSARMTEASARGWGRFRGLARAMLGRLDLVLAQDDATAGRLRGLGARDDGRLNLKYADADLPYNQDGLYALKSSINERPVVLAASTHAGEDEIIAGAMPATGLNGSGVRPLLIIVPRHPARAAAMLDSLRARGLACTRRSRGEALTDATDVYVADTLGELGLFFRLCDVAVIGGSFLPGIGGHNPLEPARLETCIVTGPCVHNFKDLYDRMTTAPVSAVQVEAESLLQALSDLLGDASRRRSMAQEARAFAARCAREYETSVTRLETLLPVRRAS